MLRSMYSGISGMKNFQTKLDVIGNNIANVNTYGFKKGRVIFKDMMSQTISGASGPTAARGGVNAKQVGLGAQMAAIDTMHEGGSLQTTNRVLDLAISGDGFFQVGNADATAGFNNISFTRAGNFYMDENGSLVNSDGLYAVGFSAAAGQTDPTQLTFPEPDEMNGTIDNTTQPPQYTGGSVTPQYGPITIPTDAKSMSIGKDGSVSFVDKDGELKWAGQLVLAKFPNAGGLEKIGNNMFRQTNNSGTPLLNFAGTDGIGTTESGFLEMSNVDLSEEFTEMIVAQRGFQANTKIITTSDEILQELVNLKR
ncbi:MULTISPECIES: flagellar basal body rod protein FlgG [Bacillaceae]|uniref:flagellar basal body rod protein FlgG n=1 Tax=Bacillaceae TaxID=186817 RepID=UPI000B9C6437|nr:flagellar basal body rod protein FlgG [Bacillus infantis]MCK6206206.1 flagellar basal body rod protein FlgG [Bacillus infantis]MDW2876937.1 flagellar basal body rod protein FlgG [Bacillus infantis]OXT18650.1 flagellar basal body rod protein FlgG [Bacillus sp. OG2]